MINYHLHLPKKMGVKLFYPRRRSFIFKVLAFCTFIGFVGLWFKNEDVAIENEDIALRKVHREGPNDILALDKSKSNKLLTEVREPDNQIIDIKVENHAPVHEVRLPPPKVPHNLENLKKPESKPHIVSKEEKLEKLKADRWFAEDEMKVVKGLGEMGKAVKLSGEEGRLAEEVMKKEAFNLIASDKISLNRSVPDSRDS
ncbi:hypothetical protein OTU49_003602, partial [Cherax quadricarinatus]